MAQSIHKDHRKRMKERFLQQGLDSFTEVQALEFLLFFCIPQGDTNELAHRLIQRFGSLSQVLDAPVEELKGVAGIGDHSAILIRLMNQMARYYLVNKVQQERILATIDDCAGYLQPRFHGRKVETVFLLCLDAKCKVLSCREVGEGSVNSAGISVRRIVETALREGASTVVLAHNHPSGIALPSAEDIQTTRRIAAALQSVEIALADHIVVADDDYVSMVQSGYRFDDCVFV
ncbi:MAG: DNA repair protein RadC [Oscillospiraceae bacterium]|nr:DNA repair protein RadC [Oscillospiraceae bacterium]MBQ7129625.1 DNA repair protein RadC [Oscillospiraceae bacterium]